MQSRDSRAGFVEAIVYNDVWRHYRILIHHRRYGSALEIAAEDIDVDAFIDDLSPVFSDSESKSSSKAEW